MWHATRTQNPRVYESWRSLHGESLLPNLNGRTPTTREIAIAQALAHGAAFEEKTFISRRVYQENRGGANYHACRSPEISALFASSLGPFDAFILLAQV